MIRIKTELVNELGSEIEISVTVDERGVTVEAQGPTSQMEHTWTPFEAQAIRHLLELVEPAYKDR